MTSSRLRSGAIIFSSGLAIGFSTLPASAQCGSASWYALTSKTASGERMNPEGMTAAHRSLAFGSGIKVVNQNNGREVVVRVNDRGPFTKGRVLDLSRAAAGKLGFVRAGHTKICLEQLG